MSNDKSENIKELGKNEIVMSEERIQILPIIGEIEGHEIINNSKTTKYDHILPRLAEFEDDDENEEEDGLEWLQEESSDIDALMAELMGSDSLTSRPSEMEQWVEELLESADSEEEE